MKPMLAATVEDFAGLRFPKLVSPKLDGVRALVKDGVVLSRKFLPIPNRQVQLALGHPEFNGFDGELIAGTPYGDGVFNRTTRVVMKEDGSDDFVFHVFDHFALPATAGFDSRYSWLVGEPALRTHDKLQLVEHVRVANMAELLEQEQRYVDLGYEGLMMRSPAGLYKHGRSTENEGGLLKMKRFADSEAVVLDALAEQANNNPAEKDAFGRTKRSTSKANKVDKDSLGRLLVRDVATGTEFRIGTGFDQAEQARLWALHKEGKLVGQYVKYQFQVVGVLNKPRFPSYRGLRDPRDMS